MKKKIILSVILMTIAGACGIEGIQSVIRLNSPLGVKLESVSNNTAIKVTFWGLNDEDFFSGYDIYIAANTSAAEAGSGLKCQNLNMDWSKPTISGLSPVTVATQYTYVILYNVTNNTDYPFKTTIDYFIYVKAYSEVYNVHSGRSDYAVVHLTN